VARVPEEKSIKTFGDVLRVYDEVYYAFPTPQKLASVTIEQFRLCGSSQRKAEYIKGASKSIVEGKLDLENLKNPGGSKEIIEELYKIRGIGAWTAELTMTRGMQKLDVIPTDDLGLRRTISHYYCDARKISSEEARTIAKNRGKWARLAGFYLIVAERLGIVIPFEENSA
jgi:DNA-3-methyladenine glycosylase II